MARLVASLMALYLFDISVDFQHQHEIEENTGVNEIESLSELLLEEIADFENLFEEIPEAERESTTKASLSIVYVVPQLAGLQPVTPTCIIKFVVLQEDTAYAAPFSIVAPPPRQA